ncbi:hypothetical protein [Aminipila terrae]|uniref:Uncharacterized protein n=1 Tax=Aminipila terrae TaxID=2697030 RepID=A0A6P1MAF3_9FIRM|nr:hypothetical protein [Aminipila terrae]QHI71600.1 hypothetical protein Ami3637_03675 [Aminipila terrae]
MTQTHIFSFQKPEFHMHDCYVTDVSLSEQSLVFELEHGIYILKNKDYIRTGPAKLVFAKLSNLECEIQYLRDNHRECVDTDVLEKDLESGYIDMIYEMYNESVAHFEGILIQGTAWKTVEMNIFFHELTIFYEERELSADE